MHYPLFKSDLLRASLTGLALSLAMLLTPTGLVAAPNVTTPAEAAATVAVGTAISTPGASAPLGTPSSLPDNPYGLSALWAQGDAIAKITLLVLVLMSVSSWYVIFSKWAEQRRMHVFAQAAQGLWRATSSLREASLGLEASSPFRFIAEKSLEGAAKHSNMVVSVDFNTWVSLSIQRALSTVQSRLQNGLTVLATVGATAPFVGLFGTVWGIYHALVKIGISGQASIDKVAGPVGEALIMTAIGLAVAVPAVLGYNWLVRRNKAVMEEVHAFGADLHAVLLASAGK
ncbi:MotA/TolQ/ExbB proton channel family protein [Limnohabitans sp.]|jgi:biopolymer transport protein ExbB|uniref:MotA/TolQ/ExbB proton channel family protein n=1 Tax=Limnohabitans sp. TaxID=1907725 RepID=UPI0025E3B2A1|nr:MotA/TolQ/ExbB proton channel family protein [Limnohabitans sp.]